MPTTAQATCRGCGRPLNGAAFHTGKPPPILEDGEKARRCHYGGWVCSRECDVAACLRLEGGQPGTRDLTEISTQAAQSVARNWQ